jgi:hypothetical protein
MKKKWGCSRSPDDDHLELTAESRWAKFCKHIFLKKNTGIYSSRLKRRSDACPLLREMPRCHHALPSQKTGLIQSRFSGFRNLITKLSRGKMCLVTSWFFVRYVPREKATFLRRAAGHTRQHASRTSIPGLSISQNDGFYSLRPIILFINTDVPTTRYV